MNAVLGDLLNKLDFNIRLDRASAKVQGCDSALLSSLHSILHQLPFTAFPFQHFYKKSKVSL